MFCSDGGTTKLELFSDGGKVGGIERKRENEAKNTSMLFFFNQ